MSKKTDTHLLISEQFLSTTENGYMAKHIQLTKLLLEIASSHDTKTAGFVAAAQQSPQHEMLHQACENIAREMLLSDEEMKIPIDTARTRALAEFSRLQRSPSAAAASRGTATH